MSTTHYPNKMLYNKENILTLSNRLYLNRKSDCSLHFRIIFCKHELFFVFKSMFIFCNNRIRGYDPILNQRMKCCLINELACLFVCPCESLIYHLAMKSRNFIGLLVSMCSCSPGVSMQIYSVMSYFL